MEIIDSPALINRLSRSHRREGRAIALVPTMGALHEGHLSLVRAARERSDVVLMSIFVNPRQFNVAADYDRYPRTWETDLALAEATGVSAVYAPAVGTMYPDGFDTVVRTERTAAPLEGAGRPGHFDGVATVVTKLLVAAEPDLAVFGQKDYQQLAVIRRLVADLDLPVEILGAPTVREPDGLAMSSRNTRLSTAARKAAPVIKRGLDSAASAVLAGGPASGARDAFAAVLSSEPLARVEYVSVADTVTLEELRTVDGPCVISCAVWFDDIRLIDNVVVGP